MMGMARPAALLGCLLGLAGFLLLVSPAGASSNGLRVRAVDPLAQPDSFRIVVEVDPSVDAGFGTTPVAGNFGIELADGKATKLFLPLETSGILGSLGAISEVFAAKNDEPES